MRTPLVDDLVGLNLGAAFAAGRRISLTAALPVWVHAEDAAGDSAAALGDLRLATPITLWSRALADPEASSGGWTVSAVPYVDLPTGNPDLYLGSGGFGGGAVGAVGYGLGRVQVFANAGGEWTPRIELENLQGGPFLKGGLGASAYVYKGVALRAEAVLSASPLPNPLSWSESPAEALLSARGRSKIGLGWTLGGATALNSGAGAAVFRAFAGVSWTSGKRAVAEEAPAAAALEETVCDPDGAPIPLAEVTLDQQVLNTGPTGAALFEGLRPGRIGALTVKAPKFRPTNVDPFFVQAGLNNRGVVLEPLDSTLKVIALDKAGNQPMNARVRFLEGPVDHPLAQLGEDGEEAFELKPGAWRVLIGADGYRAVEQAATLERGDFRTLVVRLDATAEDPCKGAVVLHSVHFDFNVDTPQAGALPALQDMAVALKDCPDVVVEVGGHTDSKGSDLYNLDLSQRRMESVKAVMVGFGVAPERLVAKGYGEAKPIASNKTDKGRASNRRVEFAPIQGAAVVVPAPMPEEPPPAEAAPAEKKSGSSRRSGR